MMERFEIINQFKELHKFISTVFDDLDKEVMTLLKKEKFVDNVVKKCIELGVCYPTKKAHKTLYYSVAYTFFEDIEDKYGGRDNDVIFLLSIDYFEDKSYVLNREIGTLEDDIEYKNSNRMFNFDKTIELNIYSMKKDFLNYLNELTKREAPGSA